MLLDPVEFWEWIDKAEHDRSAGRRLASPECREFGVVAFLCQQAVEKLLKAYLISRETQPERTHDLRSLALQCAMLDESLRPMEDLVAPLTIYAVATRYPGVPEPSRAEVDRAMGVVDAVWEEVVRRVPSRFSPGDGT